MTTKVRFNELLNRRNGQRLVQKDVVKIRIHGLSITITNENRSSRHLTFGLSAIREEPSWASCG